MLCTLTASQAAANASGISKKERRVNHPCTPAFRIFPFFYRRPSSRPGVMANIRSIFHGGVCVSRLHGILLPTCRITLRFLLKVRSGVSCECVAGSWVGSSSEGVKKSNILPRPFPPPFSSHAPPLSLALFQSPPPSPQQRSINPSFHFREISDEKTVQQTDGSMGRRKKGMEFLVPLCSLLSRT